MSNNFCNATLLTANFHPIVHNVLLCAGNWHQEKNTLHTCMKNEEGNNKQHDMGEITATEWHEYFFMQKFHFLIKFFLLLHSQFQWRKHKKEWIVD